MALTDVNPRAADWLSRPDFRPGVVRELLEHVGDAADIADLLQGVATENLQAELTRRGA